MDTPHRRPGGHYLHREPLAIIAIPALIASLALIMLVTMQIRAARSRPSVAFVSPAAQIAPSMPVLQVQEEDWLLNGNPTADTDLLFRLSAMASDQTAIIIEAPHAMPSHRTARALDFANRAGFTNIAIRMADAPN